MTESIKSEQLLLAEMQVLLAEMRTHLSLVRTGAGIVVSTATVGFLIFSNSQMLPHYVSDYGSLIYAVLATFTLGGIFLFIRSERKILAITNLIKDAEKKNKRIDKLMV